MISAGFESGEFLGRGWSKHIKMAEAIDKPRTLEEELQRPEMRAQIEKFLRDKGIECLDDVISGFPIKYESFWDFIGAERSGVNHSVTDIRKRLVELTLLSPAISDYNSDIKNRIIDKILVDSHGTFSSYYLDKYLEEDVWMSNIKVIFEELKRIENIKHLDDINTKIASKTYGRFFNSIGIKKNTGPSKIGNIKRRFVELGLLSSRISDYDKNIQMEIIKTILRPRQAYKSYYLNRHIDEEIWRENVSLIFEELKKTKKIKTLDDINAKIANSGFWNAIGVRRDDNKFYCTDSDVKTRLIHLNFFNEEVEKRYSRIIEGDSVVELLKKIDHDLFRYKHIKYAESKVDKESFKIFNSFYKEKIREGITINNCLDLFEYYLITVYRNPDEIKESLKRLSIEHLDDINSGHLSRNKRLWKSLGLKDKNGFFAVCDVKQRLADLGIFSLLINEYQDKKVKDRIIQRILKQTGVFKSYYLNEQSVEDSIIRNNALVIIDTLKITNLDEITSRIANKYTGFWGSIGIKKSKENFNDYEVKMGLINLGYFSSRINDYSDPIKEKIVSRILNPPNNNFNSIYIDISKLDYESLIDNMGVVLSRIGIKHLDDIEHDSYHFIWSSIGVGIEGDKFKLPNIKKRLVELGLFSVRISDYKKDIQEEIIELILNSMKRSYYVSNSLNKEVWVENVKITFEELKKREGIKHLDDIKVNRGKGTNTSSDYGSFWDLIGVKREVKNRYHLISNIKTRLIHLGYFHDDVEQKYSYTRQEGSAVELLKMIDKQLFGYKDLQVDETKVDMNHFRILKSLNKETHEKLPVKQRPRNSIDLFEYYHKEYAK